MAGVEKKIAGVNDEESEYDSEEENETGEDKEAQVIAEKKPV